MHWKRTLMSVGLVLGATLFGVQLISLIGKLQQQPLRFKAPGYLFIALILNLLQYILQILSWGRVLSYFGNKVAIRQLFQGYLLSFLPRYIPGSVWGYLSRSQWFRQYCGISYELTIYASIMEEWAFIVTAGSLASLYAYWRFGRIEALIFFIVGLILIAVTGTSFVKVLYFLRGLIPVKLAPIDIVVSPKAWLLTCALDFGFWFTYGGAVFCIHKALIGGGSLLGNYAAMVFSVSLSWLLGFAILIVPAGLGVREWSMTQFLTLTLITESWPVELLAILARLAIVLAELGLLIVGIGLQTFTTLPKMGGDLPQITQE